MFYEFYLYYGGEMNVPLNSGIPFLLDSVIGGYHACCFAYGQVQTTTVLHAVRLNCCVCVTLDWSWKDIYLHWTLSDCEA